MIVATLLVISSLWLTDIDHQRKLGASRSPLGGRRLSEDGMLVG